jgi:hypothetical protein
VIVLTEYVEGSDHAAFLAALHTIGIQYFSCTTRRGRENQLLIGTRDRHTRCDLVVPHIHPSVPSNVLQVTLDSSDIKILGFRMPSFDRRQIRLKRLVWDWLLAETEKLQGARAIIAGDFNTAPEDSVSNCGDCLAKLTENGWQLCQPEIGFSWRHPRSRVERRIDHIFLSDSFVATQVEYLWSFEKFGPASESGKVGHPDHAILVCTFN